MAGVAQAATEGRKDQAPGVGGPVTAAIGAARADLGFKDADAMLVKAELVLAIRSIIKERALTQAQAAEIVGLAQPKLSNLLRGEFHGVSERRLMDCLIDLGRDLEIVIKEKPRSRPNGRLSVVVS